VLVNTDLIHTDIPVSEFGVGRPEQQALILAANHDVDLHLACDLLAQGCDPTVAAEILL